MSKKHRLFKAVKAAVAEDGYPSNHLSLTELYPPQLVSSLLLSWGRVCAQQDFLKWEWTVKRGALKLLAWSVEQLSSCSSSWKFALNDCFLWIHTHIIIKHPLKMWKFGIFNIQKDSIQPLPRIFVFYIVHVSILILGRVYSVKCLKCASAHNS